MIDAAEGVVDAVGVDQTFQMLLKTKSQGNCYHWLLYSVCTQVLWEVADSTAWMLQLMLQWIVDVEASRDSEGWR